VRFKVKFNGSLTYGALLASWSARSAGIKEFPNWGWEMNE